MLRCFTALAALVLVVCALHASQDQPAPKKADVVKQLHKDFDEARARLQKDDSGAATRAAHRRIIEGIDLLLEQEDDPSAQPPPQGQVPKEKNPGTAKPKPAPQQVPEGKAAPAPGERPEVGPDGPWDPRRVRRSEPVDAAARERFPTGYEELLRAYYRSIAAGKGEE